MTTAKEEIKKHRDFFAKLVRESDELAEKTTLTYGQSLDQNSRVAWERSLTFALALIEDEENGTLDAKLAALASKPKTK